MNEHKAREYVRKLRRFYTDALIYGIVNLGLILIWAISGGGYFWPIWVIVGWGIGLGVHAFSLGLIPQIDAMVPFMTPEWEEEEVRRLTEEGSKEKTKSKPPTKMSTPEIFTEETEKVLRAAVKPLVTKEKPKAAPKKKSGRKTTPKSKA